MTDAAQGTFDLSRPADEDLRTLEGDLSSDERHDLIMIALLAGIALRSLVWTTLQYVLEARVDEWIESRK